MLSSGRGQSSAFYQRIIHNRLCVFRILCEISKESYYLIPGRHRKKIYFGSQVTEEAWCPLWCIFIHWYYHQLGSPWRLITNMVGLLISWLRRSVNLHIYSCTELRDSFGASRRDYDAYLRNVVLKNVHDLIWNFSLEVWCTIRYKFKYCLILNVHRTLTSSSFDLQHSLCWKCPKYYYSLLNISATDSTSLNECVHIWTANIQIWTPRHGILKGRHRPNPCVTQ